MKSYLDAVFEAIKLSPYISLALDANAICPAICGFAPEYIVKLTSQQELAIWQPAWPTVHVTLSACVEMINQAAPQYARARVSGDSPFKLMTSLMLKAVNTGSGYACWGVCS